MPEGDSIFRTAQALHRALAGSHVSRFESVLPALTRVDIDRTLAGRRVESVTARGKHLLMAFSGDLILHTHMRMSGSWHLYRSGERWRHAARDMRIILETTNVVAVAFNVPVTEFLSARDLLRHTQLQMLGPDPLDPSFDRAEVVHRMHAHAGEAIADVLLNQRVIAGLGNVFKAEVLFVAGIDPFRKVGLLSEDELQRVIAAAKTLLAGSVMSPSQTLSRGGGRRTTRSMNPTANLWAYGRAGKPCRRCGTPIRAAKTGLDARLTYWCPACQT